MSVYANLSIEEREQLNREILERDKKCVLCKSRHNLDVHEIIPRSAFGSKTMHICFSPKNRVALCRQCHSTAHTKEVREKLLQYIDNTYKGKEENA